MAHYEDLTIDQGTDISIDVYLVTKNGSAKDLAGYTVAAKMATSYDAIDSDKVSFLSSVVAPASDGIVNLTLSNTQSDLLTTKKRYMYDVEISATDSDGTIVERVLEGLITVTPSVT
tara:strand:- start:3172 stop:3522 length:351 start_codon:yes stop_codon:yes gene_type:complete